MLAFLNILGAATLGVLIGFDKVYHFLPGFVLANVFAHAHLAALGWATMMVVGVAFRRHHRVYGAGSCWCKEIRTARINRGTIRTFTKF